MNQVRRHPQDAPASVGAILCSEVPLDNDERLTMFNLKLRQFHKARWEPGAPNMFPGMSREYTLTQQAREATPSVLRLVCRRGK